MAIAVTSRKRTVFGNKVILFIEGTFADNDTSGDVVTGLSAIDHVQSQFTDLLDATVNPTVSGGTVTLTITDPGATVNWTMMVIGH